VNTWTQSLSSYRWSQAEHDELVRWPRFPETLFVRLRSLEA